MAKIHLHPCANRPQGCVNTVKCDGEWVRNVDGFPEVVCDRYHNPNGTTDPQPCAACYDDTCVLCEQVVRLVGHAEGCSQHPDNYDGPPDDDDAWSGGFASNH